MRDRARCRRGILIRQHHDRCAVFRKYHVLGRESRDFAAVLEHEVIALHSDIESEGVAGAGAVVENDFALEVAIRRGGEQSVPNDIDVPGGEILCRHRELAGGPHPSRPRVGRGAKWSETVANVAGSVRSSGTDVEVHRARESGWYKNP